MGRAVLAGALDAVRADHEAQAAESFNDDATYKARINEVTHARIRIRVCTRASTRARVLCERVRACALLRVCMAGAPARVRAHTSCIAMRSCLALPRRLSSHTRTFIPAACLHVRVCCAHVWREGGSWGVM